MARALLACSVLALVSATAGCRMCAHPYDYCGPTYTGQCGQACVPLGRAGSVLSPPLEVAPACHVAPAADSPEVGPTDAAPVPGDAPSNDPDLKPVPDPGLPPASDPTTETVVSPEPDPNEATPIANSITEEIPGVEGPAKIVQAAQSQGWTARKPGNTRR